MDTACGNCPHSKGHHYFGDGLGSDGRMHTWCQMHPCACTDYALPKAEADAPPASEGLRAALEAMVEDHDAREHYTSPGERMREWPCTEPAATQARAALASDAGSVGASKPYSLVEIEARDSRKAKALASDAGSVGALDSEGVNKIDPERLARALHFWCVQVDGEFALAHEWQRHKEMAAFVLAKDAERQGES